MRNSFMAQKITLFDAFLNISVNSYSNASFNFALSYNGAQKTAEHIDGLRKLLCLLAISRHVSR